MMDSIKSDGRWRLCWLVAALLVPAAGARPARADAPVAAGMAVRRFLEADRANDPAALLAAIADDYDYNGVLKKDITPFGPFAILSDHLVYQITQVLGMQPGVASALVDLEFTGRLNLDAYGRGEPTVVGTERAWIEVRQQSDGQWRVSGLRPVHLHYTHPGSPSTFVTGVMVNGETSVIAAPGASLKVAGETEFGLTQGVFIGTDSQVLTLHLDQNSLSYEAWAAALKAPAQPGRYYLDTSSFFYGKLADGTIYLAADEVTVPVVVKQ